MDVYLEAIEVAILSDQDRFDVWAEWMRDPSEGGYIITKQDIRAAVDALDTWLNDNAAAANNAIPQPARSALNTQQKARLMTRIIHKRYLVGA